MASINAKGRTRKEAEEVATMIGQYLYDNGTRLHVETLKKFASENITIDVRQMHFLNEDELEDRRRYMLDVQSILLEDESLWKMTEERRKSLQQARFWSLLLVMDFQRLKGIHEALKSNETERQDERKQIANNLELAIDTAAAYAGYATCRPDRVRGTLPPKKARIKRDREVAKQARLRDGNKCIATGGNRYQVCHLAAFFGTNRQTTIKFLIQHMAILLGPRAVNELVDRLYGENNIIDSLQNVVTLSGKLHTYMDDAIFGLQPVGYTTRIKPPAEADEIKTGQSETDSRGTTQFGMNIRTHWIPATKLRNMFDKVEDFGADPREMMEEWSAANYEYRSESGHPLDTGTIITIWADKKEDLPDWRIMEFLFNALCFHRMNGGADPLIYLPWVNYDDDDAAGNVHSSDHRMEAEQIILQVLAEDDKAGQGHEADRKRSVEEKILRAFAELGIAQSKESSSTASVESRETWIPPHLRHKYASNQSSASSKGSEDEQEPAAPRD